jgi:anthranilate phosphoribosyltransferase
MSNPANVKRQLIGVFARQWLRPMAETLKQLGSEKVWIVHGADGADELTLSGPASVCALEGGALREFEVTPEDAGLGRAPLDAVRGGDPEKNAAALAALLDGERSPFRDTVLLNAGAALIVADKAKTLREGAALAASAIDGGHAKAKLAKLVEISRRPKPEAE